jgi:hypothetical protein
MCYGPCLTLTCMFTREGSVGPAAEWAFSACRAALDRSLSMGLRGRGTAGRHHRPISESKVLPRPPRAMT